MKVLVVGGGGREHALAWKLAQSPRVTQVYVAPGNAGTASEVNIENIAIDATNIDGLVNFAQRENIALTVVGPEQPLVLGIVDAFQAADLRCFGPVRAAAQLEGSKSFSKDFLARHHIPSADYQVFTDVDAAISYIEKMGAPIVVKADGLAAGKGVIVANTEVQAIDAVKNMLAGNAFGEAGHSVVIEEFLTGEEASFIAMIDGKHILPLASSQDHKARDNGDRGPNTGGMGAYSPAPVVTPEIHQRVMDTVMKPTLAGLQEEGIPYVGFLYAGLMIDAQGVPKVLEFNCRFGDPETQPIMLRLESDLSLLCDAAIDGKLQTVSANWNPKAALGVVLAAGGYPEQVRNGEPISGLDQQTDQDTKIFHAGTKAQNGEVVTAGGRVLCATALGENVQQAQQAAYALVKHIHWRDMYFRTDIGYRAIEREKQGRS